MARVTNNLLLQGISGKIGGLVLRQVGAQTIVSAAEAPGNRAPRSPRQQAQLERMYRAQCYAKAQIRDPAAKALYATRIDARRTSAYTVAIADYLNAPQIQAVDLGGYRGRAGDAIRIHTTDDFAVTAVAVRVQDAAGQPLAEGPAVLQPDGSWLFTPPQPHAVGPGSTVHVEARDRPGNCTTHTVPL